LQLALRAKVELSGNFSYSHRSANSISIAADLLSPLLLNQSVCPLLFYAIPFAGSHK
jgi:hypothetical protein